MCVDLFLYGRISSQVRQDATADDDGVCWLVVGQICRGETWCFRGDYFSQPQKPRNPRTPHKNPGALPVIKLRKELTEHQRKKLIKLENVSGLDAFFGRMGLHKLAARVFFFFVPSESYREERHVERENFIALQSMRFFNKLELFFVCNTFWQQINILTRTLSISDTDRPRTTCFMLLIMRLIMLAFFVCTQTPGRTEKYGAN